jgi:hypothetical protein
MRKAPDLARPFGLPIMLGILLSVGAHGQPIDESQVKAAFLYNFAKFVEWTPDSGAPAITFCIAGAAPLYNALEESLRGKNINGRTAVTRQIEAAGETRGCQVLFIGQLDKKRVGEILQAVTAANLLTVGDSDEFAQRGGMIGLIKSANKFRFVVNVDAVSRHGMRVSSKLLQLAEVLHEPVEARKRP